MHTRLLALSLIVVMAACGGGGGGSSTSPTAPPTPVSVSVTVMSSAGAQLGSFKAVGDTRTAFTFAFTELASKQVAIQGMHEKFMVLRGANQGDRIGAFVANTATGSFSWVPTADRDGTTLVLWLFPTGRFRPVNRCGKVAVSYDCAYSNSNINLGRGIVKRYGVSVGKFRPGTLIWSGPWKGPGYDLGTVNIVAYDGPEEAIVEAVTLLNRFLDLGSVKLGSLGYTGAADSGDMIGGYGWDYEKQPGFEGLHHSAGEWFIERHSSTIERHRAYNWMFMYIEAWEAWTKSDDLCTEGSVCTLLGPVGSEGPHATSGWSDEGVDLLRFAALMSPSD